MSKRHTHTPGPWFLSEERKIWAGKPVGGEHPLMIAQVTDTVEGLEGDCPEADANAQLIEAAPKLLAALKGLLENPSKPSALRKARIAIAQAVGGQS